MFGALTTLVLAPWATQHATGSEIGWVRIEVPGQWLPRAGHASVVFDDRIWVLGGFVGSNEFLNDVWFSTDGANWTQATANAAWSPRVGHSSVVHDGKIWVIGGVDANQRLNDVWYSGDGVNWTEATANAMWSPRDGHTSVAFDGKVWLMGGDAGDAGTPFKNDVWFSANGVNWTKVVESASWSPRWHHSSLVYDDRLWILGGNTGGQFSSREIWYSSDGANWTKAADTWASENGAAVVYHGIMGMLGGITASGVAGPTYSNDVWTSSDGVTWAKQTYDPIWSKREGHTAVVFDGRIFVIGGSTQASEVWYLEDPTFPVTLSSFSIE